VDTPAAAIAVTWAPPELGVATTVSALASSDVRVHMTLTFVGVVPVTMTPVETPESVGPVVLVQFMPTNPIPPKRARSEIRVISFFIMLLIVDSCDRKRRRCDKNLELPAP
jgi:hypothetical protein